MNSRRIHIDSLVLRGKEYLYILDHRLLSSQSSCCPPALCAHACACPCTRQRKRKKESLSCKTACVALGGRSKVTIWSLSRSHCSLNKSHQTLLSSFSFVPLLVSGPVCVRQDFLRGGSRVCVHRQRRTGLSLSAGKLTGVEESVCAHKYQASKHKKTRRYLVQTSDK